MATFRPCFIIHNALHDWFSCIHSYNTNVVLLCAQHQVKDEGQRCLWGSPSLVAGTDMSTNTGNETEDVLWEVCQVTFRIQGYSPDKVGVSAKRWNLPHVLVSLKLSCVTNVSGSFGHRARGSLASVWSLRRGGYIQVGVRPGAGWQGAALWVLAGFQSTQPPGQPLCPGAIFCSHYE